MSSAFRRPLHAEYWNEYPLGAPWPKFCADVGGGGGPLLPPCAHWLLPSKCQLESDKLEACTYHPGAAVVEAARHIRIVAEAGSVSRVSPDIPSLGRSFRLPRTCW